MPAESYDDEDEQEGPKSSFTTYLAEGNSLFKQREFKKALDSYSLALDIKPENRTCLVARSKCYLRLGDTQKALQDAESSLAEDKEFIKGLYRKAEALYSMGDFEYALMYYHRGHNLRPELDEFRLGIQKTQEAIDNSIGNAANIKLENKGDLSFFSKQDDLGNKKRPGYTKPTRNLKLKPTTIANRNKEVKPPAPSKKTVKQLLGELYADKEYLEKLMHDDDFIKNHPNKPIHGLVKSGITFLDARTEFWRQQRPLYARKNINVDKSTKKKKKLSRGKQILKQLEDIDRALASGDPDGSLNLAQTLLKSVEETDGNDLPNKIEVLSNIHSCIGNAYVELENLNKALKHHQKDVQMSLQSGSIEGKSRALDNVGRVYARMEEYEKAVESWNEKLPLIKTPLETTWIYHEIGRCHLELGDFQEASECGHKSLSAANEFDDEVWQLNATVLIAQASVKLGKWRESLERFQEGKEIALSLSDSAAQNAIEKAIVDLEKKIEEDGTGTSNNATDETTDNNSADEDEDDSTTRTSDNEESKTVETDDDEDSTTPRVSDQDDDKDSQSDNNETTDEKTEEPTDDFFSPRQNSEDERDVELESDNDDDDDDGEESDAQTTTEDEPTADELMTSSRSDKSEQEPATDNEDVTEEDTTMKLSTDETTEDTTTKISTQDTAEDLTSKISTQDTTEDLTSKISTQDTTEDLTSKISSKDAPSEDTTTKISSEETSDDTTVTVTVDNDKNAGGDNMTDSEEKLDSDSETATKQIVSIATNEDDSNVTTDKKVDGTSSEADETTATETTENEDDTEVTPRNDITGDVDDEQQPNVSDEAPVTSDVNSNEKNDNIVEDTIQDSKVDLNKEESIGIEEGDRDNSSIVASIDALPDEDNKKTHVEENIDGVMETNHAKEKQDDSNDQSTSESNDKCDTKDNNENDQSSIVDVVENDGEDSKDIKEDIESVGDSIADVDENDESIDPNVEKNDEEPANLSTNKNDESIDPNVDKNDDEPANLNTNKNDESIDPNVDKNDEEPANLSTNKNDESIDPNVDKNDEEPANLSTNKNGESIDPNVDKNDEEPANLSTNKNDESIDPNVDKNDEEPANLSTNKNGESINPNTDESGESTTSVVSTSKDHESIDNGTMNTNQNVNLDDIAANRRDSSQVEISNNKPTTTTQNDVPVESNSDSSNANKSPEETTNTIPVNHDNAN